MDDKTMLLVILAGVLVAALLAFIPASIASKKGKSFWLWWLLGLFISFPIALICAIMIPDERAAIAANIANSLPQQNVTDLDVKMKLNDLYSLGILTHEECRMLIASIERYAMEDNTVPMYNQNYGQGY